MSERLRMGYVGCGGFMAQKVHIPNMVSLPRIELAAVADVRADVGEEVRRRFGIPKLYASHQELARDGSLQAVAVSGHFSGQGEIAIHLLESGKDVFMEKPMAVSVAQAERIVQAEKRSGRRVLVAHMKRYDAGNILFKQALDGFRQTGELGPITFVRNHGFGGDWIAGLDTPYLRSAAPKPEAKSLLPDWLPQDRVDGYLGYLQQYCHNINLVRWFLDDTDTVRVKAVDLGPDGISGVVVLEIRGVRVTIESGSVDYHGWDEHTQIYFRHGWMKTDAPPLLLKNVAATVEIYRKGPDGWSRSELLPKNLRSWAYREEMAFFAEAVLDGKPFRTPASDCLVDCRVYEEIYKTHLASR